MSPKMKSNAVATTLVALFLVLGCIFGYVVLGGSNATPSNANVPVQKVSCLICGGGVGGGGDVPPPFPVSGSGSGGNIAR